MDTMRTYVTLFDRNYAEMGVVLMRSLQRHAAPCEIFVLCMDDAAHKVVTAWAANERLEGLRVRPVHHQEVDTPALLAACVDRGPGERCWTYTATALLMALERSGASRVTYLDADTMFFASPEPAHAEMGDKPITIVPHRFSQACRHLLEYGEYNVNWVSMTSGEPARALLERWERDCIAWCYARHDATGGWGDQLYWDRYAKAFPVHGLQHIGVGVAPWNADNYVFDKGPTVNGVPIIQYHYHGLGVTWDAGCAKPVGRAEKRQRRRNTATFPAGGMVSFTAWYKITWCQRQCVYEPYVTELHRARAAVLAHEAL